VITGNLVPDHATIARFIGRHGKHAFHVLSRRKHGSSGAAGWCWS